MPILSFRLLFCYFALNHYRKWYANSVLLQNVQEHCMAKKNTYRELSPSDLYWKCPLTHFAFSSTKELEPLHDIVGQPRAIESIQLGAQLTSPGYNLFVSGLSGTGRLTTVKKILEDVRRSKVQLCDFCYVHNFTTPNEPRLLQFNEGLGMAFAKAMEETMVYLRLHIPQLFEEEGFQKTRKDLTRKYQEREAALLTDFNEKLQPEGFILGRVENEAGTAHPAIFIVINDKLYSPDDLDELVNQEVLPLAKAREISEHYQAHQDELLDLARSGIKLMQEFRRALAEHDRLAAGVIVKSAIDELRGTFNSESAKVGEYLDTVENDLLANVSIFNPSRTSVVQEQTEDTEESIAKSFEKYNVNVILDNSATEYPPVIVETTPSFVNLFGTIEKKLEQSGIWTTDFRFIKGGSLLKAHGGYLILNALDIFSETGVWKALKRVLLHRKLEIQPMDSYFQISQTILKPEPINIDVKIILIGDQDIYRALYFQEEDFRKIFKINSEFDYETELNDIIIGYYTRFIAKICEEEQLQHLDKSGVASIIEFAVANAGDRSRITLRFSDVADVIRESSFYARQASSKLIRSKDVEQALEKRRWRNSLLDEKIRNSILDGTVLIDTEGSRIGQINGLSVYSTGLISFGKPTRITASVGVGTSGIMNIEREADLSGSSHDKGLLILSGILRNRFAHSHPLSLSASIAFEQSYGGVDGDSASSTEIYALISALARVPIRQDLAVTGSINQQGDIQPIGGVNEKIEGFFEICAARGLTGTQGVLIPVQNVKDLMLHKSVVEAVKKKKFHIYPVSTIEEGIEILTGMPAGTPNENFVYPPNTLFGNIANVLDEFHNAVRDFNPPPSL